MGLTPKAQQFGALEFGTWMHSALGFWYGSGFKRNGELHMHFNTVAELSIAAAQQAGAPEHLLDKAWELAALGQEMTRAYTKFYHETDPNVDVVAVEVPLEFEISQGGEHVATYLLKPDMLFRVSRGKYRLMEHKTAASIRTAHLAIDGQARPYGVLAERAYKRAGILDKNDEITGITYNFLRKALPDEREHDAQGRALNKNGTVSKKQPPANFVRHPVNLTLPAKRVTLNRILTDAALITAVSDRVRDGRIAIEDLSKTPHNSCPKVCAFWAICEAEENGIDIANMRRSLFTRRDPYQYEESTDEPKSFEMG